MNNLFIREGISVKKALKSLDIAATKVLIVVDEFNRLLGTLSDGDVRRFILKDGDLNESIEKIYNKNPVYIYDKDLENIKYIKTIFLEKKIDLLPVLNINQEVFKTIDWETFFSEKERKEISALNIPVIIMAGGKGTRLEPFTNVLPKPLIPIGNKTMIEYIIDEYRKYRINKYFITINYKGNLVKAYFSGNKRDYSIEYIEETDFLGTAGSLNLIKDIPQTCIVSNCDIIVKADYNDVLQFHNNNNATLTVLSSIQHHVIPYGVIEFENGGVVTSIKEKPEFSFPINTGVYVLERDVWEYIPENTFFHMTHLIDALLKDGRKVVTYPVNENDYSDIGQWKEYTESLKKLL